MYLLALVLPLALTSSHPNVPSCHPVPSVIYRATAKQVDKGIGGKDNPDYNTLPDGANGYEQTAKNAGGSRGSGNGSGKTKTTSKKGGQVGKDKEKEKEKERRKKGASGNARAFNSNISPYELTLPDLLHGKVIR